MPTSPLHRFRRPLAISSWITFAISLAFYWITVDPGVSYWDCPEYVTVASKMEVGHPPGNPIWMLAMRVATIPFEPHHHALVINLWSGIFMAFATFFLCRTLFIPVILFLSRNRFLRKESSPLLATMSCLIAGGASLCFALCDSVWFSAVEAEVYALSTFLSSLSIWLMEVWWYKRSKGAQTRLLILLAYITGLSLGVHQLNLLLLPVFALIIFYKNHRNRTIFLLPLFLIIISIAGIALILLGYLPGLLFGASRMELLSVNKWGMPYDTGVILFSLTLFSLFIILLAAFNFRRRFYAFTTFIWMAAFLTLGFSSFGMIMIRAKAAPPMNEGKPDNIFALDSYIQREQYPSSPLLYGQTPYSRPLLEETFINGEPHYSRYILKKGKPLYLPYTAGAMISPRSGFLSTRDSFNNSQILNQEHGYILSDYNFTQKLTPELDMWMPRITSRNVADREAYVDWAGMTEENMIKVDISETKDSTGHYLPKMTKWGERQEAYSYKPTYLQNLRFFLAYQSYYMYFRYLFWNFIGRQNDFPSQGEIEHGNFITGFSPFDRILLGDTDKTPEEIGEENPGRNRYFGIPFILGVVGICFLACYNRYTRRQLSVITLLYLMTGMAIVVYLNQSPGEPRERDYTFLVSFMAFTMWICAGITAFVQLAIKSKSKTVILLITIILSIGTPSLMAVENFDDHDRRGRFEPTFYASSILDFELPAIHFSQGDNSTFPLWYATEVLRMGEDHIPVDVTYLSLPSYMVNLKKQTPKGLPTIANSSQIAFGKFSLIKLAPDSLSSHMPLNKALSLLYNSPGKDPFLPTSKVSIPTFRGDSIIINLRDFTKGSSYLSFKHLMLLDIIATQSEAENPKAVYFPTTVDYSFYKPLAPLLKPALFGKIYAPGLPDSLVRNLMKVSVERELDKLPHIFPRGKDIGSHYSDPTTADHSRRYRGNIIIAANELLKCGEDSLVISILDSINKFYPYHKLLPGNFTVEDSTFYEGKEYSLLLSKIYDITGNNHYKIRKENLDSMMQRRHNDWKDYYNSLSPSQRTTLSNRSRRLLRN